MAHPMPIPALAPVLRLDGEVDTDWPTVPAAELVGELISEDVAGFFIREVVGGEFKVVEIGEELELET